MARKLGLRRAAPLDELDVATLARCRARDPVAFRAFVARYQGAVFALLGRLLGPRAALDDLAQETFLKAHRALPSFEPDGAAKVSSWLLTIAARVALDEVKKRRPPSEPLEWAEALAGGESPERSAARRRLGKAIEAAAAQLSDEQRTVFVLFTFHDFSLEQIAATLACNPATVKTRLFRARQRLRELLEAEQSEEPLP